MKEDHIILRVEKHGRHGVPTPPVSLLPLSEENHGVCQCGKRATAHAPQCEWHPLVRLHRLMLLEEFLEQESNGLEV